MDAQELIAAALRKRAENGGRHLHHRGCIHNLPPERQITMRGKTVEWWTRIIGDLPEQITPEQWETEPPSYHLPQACPHCPEHPDMTELDDHIAAAHDDLPACTATVNDDYTDGTVQCAFRVGHDSEDYGTWHASKSVAPAGRTVWNDGVRGATPHGAGAVG